MAEKRNSKNFDEKKDRFKRNKKRVCFVCKEENAVIDYKNVELLQKYITEKGKILPRRVTGACAKHQRQITNAVKRARAIGFLPYSVQ